VLVKYRCATDRKWLAVLLQLLELGVEEDARLRSARVIATSAHSTQYTLLVILASFFMNSNIRLCPDPLEELKRSPHLSCGRGRVGGKERKREEREKRRRREGEVFKSLRLWSRNLDLLCVRSTY